jgi:DNA-directed RNA polymerase subunit M/transcription elongation factor TFIIS
MSVKAEKAISFECEKCRHHQFIEYTLDHDWEDDRAVMADNIDCEECKHVNRVIEEL